MRESGPAGPSERSAERRRARTSMSCSSPSYASTEVAAQEKFYALASRVRKSRPRHSSGSTASSTDGGRFSTASAVLCTPAGAGLWITDEKFSAFRLAAGPVASRLGAAARPGHGHPPGP